MSEEIKNDTPELEETTQTVTSNPFDTESWASEPIKSGEQAEPLINNANDNKEQVKEEEKKVEPEDEVIEPKEWLKREFDIDDPETLKAEIQEYRKSKNNKGIEFANEQSRQIHELIREGKSKEVRQFLDTQEKIESLINSDVNDSTAEEIIKLALKLKHTDLTDKEIEYKFNKQYQLPKPPVQGLSELDEEFEQRQRDWNEQVEDIKTSRIIDAKTMKPELGKAKAELVLPEIQQKENQTARKEPTQEELEAFESNKNSFLQSAEKSINGFNGFSLQVKDKDVDYTVNYSLSQDEKTIVTDKLKQFAESGFDANSLLAERWVNEDGKSMNMDQMIKDLSRIYGDDKITQKLVTDSANKRIEAYLKDKKQINVSEVDKGGKFSLEKDNKEEVVQLQEFFWNQS